MYERLPRILGIFTLGLVGTGATVTQACSGEKQGSLMLAVATDMQVPKDVNAVSLTISTNNQIKYNFLGRVTPEGEVLLPATLAIVQPDDPSASIRIRVMAFKEQKAMVLRDVRTTIPRGGRTALLRLPLNFADVGSVDGNLPASLDSTASGNSSVPITLRTTNVRLTDDPSGLGAGEFDPFVFMSNCPDPDFTWIDGECQDAYVDSNSLPDYDDSLVFGVGGTPNNVQGSSCFDVGQCFSSAVPVTPDTNTCTLAMSGDPATLNLAIVTPDIGACIHPGECYVPIDQGEGGWTAQNGTVTLPPYVCNLLNKDEGYSLAGVFGGCSPKTNSTPVCINSSSGNGINDGGVDSGTPFSTQRAVSANFPDSVVQGNGEMYFGSRDGIAYFDNDPSGPADTTSVLPSDVQTSWHMAFTSTPSPTLGIVNGSATAYLVQDGNIVPPISIPNSSAVFDVTSSEDGLYWLTDYGLYSSTALNGMTPQLLWVGSNGTVIASPSSGKVVIGDNTGGLNLWQGTMPSTLGEVPFPIQALTFDSAGIGYVLAQDSVRSFSADSADIPAAPKQIVSTAADTILDGDFTYRHGLVTNAKCVFFTSNDGLAWAAKDAENAAPNLLYQPEDGLLGLTLGTFQNQPAIYVAQYASFDTDTGTGNGGIYAVPIPPDCN
ncbi:MAG: hypothetical protein FWD69_09445 [Polyangiaceae bacterium]|nr:hypothetical protein [Polyangiaceae bacterium]